MPYIKPVNREAIESKLTPLANLVMSRSEGELNYIITRLLCAFLGSHYGYADLNAAIGVLECAKLELYRRMAAPYEDDKSYENGDVYDFAPGGPRPEKTS